MAKSLVVRQGYKETSEYWKTFPPFLWLLRDVLLEIPLRNNKKVTPTEYLKKEVLGCDGSSDGERSMGADVRMALTKLFPDFECETLPPPSADKEVMKQISTNQDKLSTLFNKGVDEIIAKLKANVKPKKIFDKTGSACNGSTLAVLVKVVANVVNDPDSIPALDNMWKLVVESRCRAVQEKLLAEYHTTVMARYDQVSKGDPIDELPNLDNPSGVSILEIHAEVHTMIIEKLWSELAPLISSQVIDRTLDTVTKQLNKQMIQYQSEVDEGKQDVMTVVGGAIFDVIQENRKRSRKFCQQLFTELYNPIRERIAVGHDGYTAVRMEADFANLLKEYDEKSVGPEKWQVRATMEKAIKQNHDIFEKHLNELLRRTQAQREAEESSKKLEGQLKSLQDSERQLYEKFTEFADHQKKAEEKREQEREAEVKELEDKVSTLVLKQREMQENETQRRVDEAIRLTEEQCKREDAEKQLRDLEETLKKKEKKGARQKAEFEQEIQSMKENIREREIEETQRKHAAQEEIKEMKRQIEEWQQKVQQKEKEEEERKCQADQAIKKMERSIQKKKEKQAEETAKYNRELEKNLADIREQRERIDELKNMNETLKEKYTKDMAEKEKQKQLANEEVIIVKERLTAVKEEIQTVKGEIQSWKNEGWVRFWPLDFQFKVATRNIDKNQKDETAKVEKTAQGNETSQENESSQVDETAQEGKGDKAKNKTTEEKKKKQSKKMK